MCRSRAAAIWTQRQSCSDTKTAIEVKTKAAKTLARAALDAEIARTLVEFSSSSACRCRRPQVYAQQQPLTLARYPNAGEAVPGSRFAGFATGSAGFVAPVDVAGAARQPMPAKLKANAISWAGGPAAGMAGRPERWARTGGAPQLAVHGAWRFEWADQMMEVAATNLTNRCGQQRPPPPTAAVATAADEAGLASTSIL